MCCESVCIGADLGWTSDGSAGCTFTRTQSDLLLTPQESTGTQKSAADLLRIRHKYLRGFLGPRRTSAESAEGLLETARKLHLADPPKVRAEASRSAAEPRRTKVCPFNSHFAHSVSCAIIQKIVLYYINLTI